MHRQLQGSEEVEELGGGWAHWSDASMYIFLCRRNRAPKLCCFFRAELSVFVLVSSHKQLLFFFQHTFFNSNCPIKCTAERNWNSSREVNSEQSAVWLLPWCCPAAGVFLLVWKAERQLQQNKSPEKEWDEWNSSWQPQRGVGLPRPIASPLPPGAERNKVKWTCRRHSQNCSWSTPQGSVALTEPIGVNLLTVSERFPNFSVQMKRWADVDQ